MKRIRFMLCVLCGAMLLSGISAFAAGTAMPDNGAGSKSSSGAAGGRTTSSRYVVRPADVRETALDLTGGGLVTKEPELTIDDTGSWYSIQIHNGNAIYDIRVDGVSGKILDYKTDVIYQYGEDDRAMIQAFEEIDRDSRDIDKELEEIINDKAFLAKYSYVWR